MRLSIYDKESREQLYFCNTEGDPFKPDVVMDGGRKAGELREEMNQWAHGLDEVTMEAIGSGDYLRASAALTLYEDKYIVEIKDLPDQPEEPERPELDRFFWE